MSDTVAMKRAIKFVQKYMAKAELPLTEADLTHAFFEGKNFGLSRAWHRIDVTRCQARCDILFFVSDYMISFTRKPRLVSSSIT